ncbi:MAG: fused MFS/spermidine synthase [Verrucomicrobiae bacterium]|nr:fused MFS/spermidine synthase [Verrucomicrobiae bacterium]
MNRQLTPRNLWLLVVLVFVALLGLAAADEKILYEKKSPFNTVVVTESEDGLRTLRFERGGARQSVVKVGDPDHIELPYARVAMVGLAFCSSPKRILVVGLGGGTIPGFVHKHYPEALVEAVDIDPEVVEVARKFFGFREDATLRAYVADGRKFIEACRQPYDIIFLDAFGTETVPYNLCTVEFFRAVRRALTARGLAVWNIWGREYNPLYDAMVRTYQEVFDELYLFDVPGTGNKILVGLPRTEQLSRAELVRRARNISIQKRFRFDLGELVAQGYQRVREKDAAARVLSDRDKAGEN